MKAKATINKCDEHDFATYDYDELYDHWLREHPDETPPVGPKGEDGPKWQ